MKVAVTGAGGYIGRHVVRALVDKGHEVVAASQDTQSADSRIAGVDYRTFNLFDESLDAFDALGRPETCIHLAWAAGFNHQDPLHIENAPKHYKLIENLIASGLRHISIAGSMHEIGYYNGEVTANTPANPLNPYGVAKNFLRQATTVLCEKHGVDFKWLRMYYITGDDAHNNSIFSKLLAANAAGQETFPLNSGEMLYDFIDSRRLGMQLALASTQTQYQGIINCCSGKPVALRTMVERFIEANGLSILPEYYKFPRRSYDAYAIWGNADIVLALEAAAGIQE
jgi:dTDP-6-deoxy-L-talose 4-dehydrogenase (NAD+)